MIAWLLVLVQIGGGGGTDRIGAPLGGCEGALTLECAQPANRGWGTDAVVWSPRHDQAQAVSPRTPIAVHVLDARESPEKHRVEVYLPAHENLMTGTYFYGTKRAREAVDDVRRALARRASGQSLLRMVDRPEDGDVLIEVVATEVQSALRGVPQPVLGRTTFDAPQTQTLVVRLSVRNDPYSVDFRGEKVDLVL